MIVLYIAGPMSGLPDFNFPAFREAEASLSISGYRVLNPVHTSDRLDPARTRPWDWYIRHALRMLLDADGVALLPGWETSRGAQLERDVAKAIGMPACDLSDWIEAAPLTVPMTVRPT